MATKGHSVCKCPDSWVLHGADPKKCHLCRVTPRSLQTHHFLSEVAGLQNSAPHPHPRHPSARSPFSEECAASVLDALQLQEARPHQQRLHVLLVDSEVAVISEVDESLQGAGRERGTEALQRQVLVLTELT